ncbi:MAG: DUF3800 domain-containing protein [Candidatus Sumerlaeota bacterium]|nr:DUF3800 domain-containing protein [Candidatus Sumerlaeota bacterium]
MLKPAFCVYIDESGDEGFSFRADGSGSLRWLVLSAIITPREKDIELVRLLSDIRSLLGKQPKQQLHFRDLKHEQRVPYVRRIAAGPARIVTVLIYKPLLRDPEKYQAEKYLLYRHATRLLLERVSWFCHEHGKHSAPGSEARIIFSNRSNMSYEDIRKYLRTLKAQSDPLDVPIEWSVINPEKIQAVNHDKLAGLQIADAVASSLFYAVNRNRYGEVEDRYARILAPMLYRHKGHVLGYGLKFWPEDWEVIKSKNPHLAGFLELGDL